MNDLVLDSRKVRRAFLNDLIAGFKDISTVVAATSGPDSNFWPYYDRLVAASPLAREQIFEDPRLAILIISAEASIQFDDIEDLKNQFAEEWVRQIKLLSISAALLDRSNHDTIHISELRRPTFLFGTKHAFQFTANQPSVALYTDAEGKLYAQGSLLEPSPTPRCGGIEFPISDYSLQPPIYANLAPINKEDVNVEKWMEVLDQAMTLIEAHPESHELVRQFSRAIIPVHGTSPNIHCSVSFSTRPGVLYLSYASNPEVIAEAMVHESDHQWFYVLTRRHSFWSEPLRTQPEIYRSPWRDDPRPLDGLLRGASAFVRVSEFWAGITGKAEHGEKTSTSTGQKAVISALQSLDALESIQEYGKVSEAGAELVRNLRSRAERSLDSVRPFPGFGEWEKNAIEEMDAHDENWRVRNKSANKDQVAV